ncbi:bifunctional riboflavin kinase/FAD synthetase [Staphylococcus pseudintermedius]|uniref:bifunctional riboflavin kinase/FAD synthetase n=1 Tax=Staphylococcus pseudintermedius TaxID=283734 RepID=UPI0018F61C02|nr:bifunctional riboflavin kinase/FAD synthetase [Staphylococcus pseudintermedius]EKI4487551.1 bifunctional riboflavin kinase/FAD synthetase [Staphylococcus pseudintermedius]ELP8690201.1 bifunctional riboflavin kinase/FAD synthetase [Staphylococcus pseudintermedius]MBJ8319471.1 bifunctional riboflavin kinase/FAD synthetase [Staphylococcus pseudintermedius]MCE5792017.1 bifunctional riboflavin kinase/FAD synthetase [Staphylococcus pseudintermedius]MCE5795889.1 bifunctional riboflavin kinase/FAD 
MEVIEITHPIQAEQYIQEDVAMALGFFDGLHRGHQALFDELDRVAKEKDLKKAVMTFDPHPSVVLNPKQKRTTYITPLDDKIELLDEQNIDYCLVVNFSSRFAEVTPDEFVQDYLVKNHARVIIAGFDFTFGKYGKGNMAMLQEYQAQFESITIGKQDLNREKISTTAIREALKTGHLAKANEQLGYRYRMKGTVVQGEKRGRTIGFPTANIEPSDDYVWPTLGVYAVSMTIGSSDQIYRGVANIGVKPTFHDDLPQAVIEVNIFDFTENIYGERVTIYWHHYIRPELKFDGIDPLVAQMNDDKARAKHLLAVDFGDDVSYNV